MSRLYIHNKHLLCRAAFGPTTENLPILSSVPTKELLRALEQPLKQKPRLLKTAEGTVDGLFKGIKEIGSMQQTSAEQRRQRRRQSAEDLRNLNNLWLDEMVHSDAQLREKMSLFWHGHFACRVVNIFFQQELLHTIRKNALGKFGDLLREVSKSPAMLSFLNNQQNRKRHPNENFARELMELFTMGRGNYTEEDVKESARAFTGWGFTSAGEFVFRANQHDNGSKKFLGQTGDFDGDDIISIILAQESTAIFITKKIYRFFVNEETDEHHISFLASRFYNSGYDIGALMRDIFSSEWFYSDKNIGVRIKSPVELLAGIRRMVSMEIEMPRTQLLIQRSLGQVLFYPPNVAGWPGGSSWIDSSSLLLRMRLPQILITNGEFTLSPKADDDIAMGREGVQGAPKIFKMKTRVDWRPVMKSFQKVPTDELPAAVMAALLQTKSGIPETIINRTARNADREQYLKSIILAVMSTPEYQLA